MNERQVADLLLGIVRGQAAIVRGLSIYHPRSADNIYDAVKGAANVGEQPVATLHDLPARVLLHCLGGGRTPDEQKHLDNWIQAELERLLK